MTGENLFLADQRDRRVIVRCRREDGDTALGIAPASRRANRATRVVGNRDVDLVEDGVGGNRVVAPLPGKPYRYLLVRRARVGVDVDDSELLRLAPPERARKYWPSPSLYQTSSEPSWFVIVSITL